MKVMTETTNGFVVSERDLALRGPGEIFGQRQSGLPEFLIADIVEHATVLEVAKQEAESIWQQKDWQLLPAFHALDSYLANARKENVFFD